MIIELNKSVIGIVPDLTLIIDIDPTKSLNRGLSRKLMKCVLKNLV